MNSICLMNFFRKTDTTDTIEIQRYGNQALRLSGSANFSGILIKFKPLKRVGFYLTEKYNTRAIFYSHVKLLRHSKQHG